MVGTPGAVRHGDAGPGPQGALLRPRLLRARSRDDVVARVADGLPARRDPVASRFRRVRDPRSIHHRGPRRRPGGDGLPERLPPSRGEGRRGSRHLREGLRLPVPRLVLRAGRTEHLRADAHDLRSAQPRSGRAQPDPGALRGVGWMRVDQPRPRCPATSPVPRTGGVGARRLEDRIDAGRVVVRLPSPRQLEAGRAGLRRAVPRRRGASATGDPRAVSAPRSRVVRPRDLHRVRDPLPPGHERRHGRHGARQRCPHRRRPAHHRASRRPRARHRHLESRVQRRGRTVAPCRRPHHPRSQRARDPGAEPTNGVLLPPLLRSADVQQRLVVPVPAARTGGDVDGHLVAHPIPGR